MGLRDRLFRRAPDERDNNPLAFSEWLNYFTFDGTAYPLTGLGKTNDIEQSVGSGVEGYTSAFLKGNGVVFACMALRLRVFSDIRFAFRELGDGGTGKLTGSLDGRNPASRGLRLLQSPEPGLTTGDLLAHMIQDVDLTGNAFVYREGSTRLRRLRPDWVTVVYGSRQENATPWDLDAELLGYLYQEGGPQKNKTPIALFPEDVAHYAPQPDPLSPRLGMSWLTPVIREVMADSKATQHKLAFFSNDATVNQQLVFREGTTREMFELARDAFNAGHAGPANAYKTLFALGAELKPVGLDFHQMDFAAVQGKMETRIAAAAGLGPVLTHMSEGLQGSSLNSGNYTADRRAVADTLFRPLWRNLCGSLSRIVEVPAGAELWYDDSDCLFLQEDRKDAAEIQKTLAETITSLVMQGFEADSAVKAVMAEDMSLLKHTDLLPVQLQKPGAQQPKPEPMPEMNGKTPASLPTGSA